MAQRENTKKEGKITEKAEDLLDGSQQMTNAMREDQKMVR